MNVQKYTNLPGILEQIGCRKVSTDSDRTKYLETYLRYIQAKSYVVEENYIDAGHLKDYAAYYAFRGDDVGKKTTRLHFFSRESKDIEEGFSYFAERHPSGEFDQYLNDHYLGFIVIRPLQETIIGRTCLRVYGDDNSATPWKRHFPLLRTYRVMVGGMRLSIRSVAFQEQDNEIAACSATAIWHTLHALPHRITAQQIESLFDISNSASKTDRRMPAPGEAMHRFPTTGLNADQIQNYLQSKGIDCLARGFSGTTESTGMLEYVQTFCDAGFPLILVGRLHVSKNRDSNYGPGELHAVTVLGYAENRDKECTSASERIGKLYVHDDTLGPFARYAVEIPQNKQSFSIYLEDKTPDKTALCSAQHLYSNKIGRGRYRRILPVYAIVPIDGGVRYPYECVAAFANVFADIIHRQLETQNGTQQKIDWTIRLKHGSDFKVSLRGADWIDSQVRMSLLEASYDYVWVIEFCEFSTPNMRERRLTAIFDANQLRQDGGLVALFASGDAGIRKNYETLLARTLYAWEQDKNREIFPTSIHPTLHKLSTAHRESTNVIPYAPRNEASEEGLDANS